MTLTGYWLPGRDLPHCGCALHHRRPVERVIRAVGNHIVAHPHPLLRLFRAAGLDTRGQPVTAAGFHHLCQRVQKTLALELAGDAHRIGQVKVAHPQTVHTRRAGDGFQIFQPFLALNLADAN